MCSRVFVAINQAWDLSDMTAGVYIWRLDHSLHVLTLRPQSHQPRDLSTSGNLPVKYGYFPTRWRVVAGSIWVKLITQMVLHQKLPCDCFRCEQTATVVCMEDAKLSPNTAPARAKLAMQSEKTGHLPSK